MNLIWHKAPTVPEHGHLTAGELAACQEDHEAALRRLSDFLRTE